MSADPIVVNAKVLPRGAVQPPPAVRERLGLKLGMNLIVATADDALVMKRSGMAQSPVWLTCRACTLRHSE